MTSVDGRHQSSSYADSHEQPIPSSSSTAASPGSVANGKAAVPRLPSNLRFQRRTSERAYLEGAYREGAIESPTMDYPGAGTSPWASSPDANRSSFQGDNIPRHDLPGPAVDQPEEGSTAHDDGDHQQVGAQGYPGGSPQQQHWQQHDQSRVQAEENRRPASAARYHNVQPQQQQRQHIPQYKLQMKITGLERTGKKDPILKFDVHVRFFCARDIPHSFTLTTIRPIYPNSEPLSSVTFDERTPSSRNWLLI